MGDRDDTADAAGTQRQAQVAAHYNNIKQRELAERQQSSIVGLRGFNNWVKALLVQRHCPSQGAWVADLCCGKGGDLFKWQKAGARFVLAADHAATSIDQLVGRAKEMHSRSFTCLPVVADLGGIDLPFHLRRKCGFLFANAAQRIDVFDIVSCQFSVHYLFEKEERIRRFMNTVSLLLRPGGTFIGTTADSNFLVRKLRSLPAGESSWGNSLHRVEFVAPLSTNASAAASTATTTTTTTTTTATATTTKAAEASETEEAAAAAATPTTTAASSATSTATTNSGAERDNTSSSSSPPPPSSSSSSSSSSSPPSSSPSSSSSSSSSSSYDWHAHRFSAFGAEYFFTLAEAVERCPEYLVSIPVWQRLASEYGLKLVQHERFHDLYAREQQQSAGQPSQRDSVMALLQRMKGVVSTQDEWEALQLYTTFVFVKEGTASPAELAGARKNYAPDVWNVMTCKADEYKDRK